MQSLFLDRPARCLALRATFVLAVLVPATSLRAQCDSARVSPSPAAAAAPAGAIPTDATAADSMSGRRALTLQTVVVTAPRCAPTLAEEARFGRLARAHRQRHEVVTGMSTNHKLSADMRRQDGEIVRLESRLVYLKTTVTDSITRQIATAEGEAAAIHARRQELEAKLAALEAAQVARQTGARPPIETPPAPSAPRRPPSGTR